MATSSTCVRLRERAEASATDPAQSPVLIVTRGARVGVEAGA